MWTEPSTWPASHSFCSRTSRTTRPSGSGSGTPETGAVGICMRLLQQTRQPSVGQGLATGLAGGAVLQGRVGEADLAHGVAADRALLAGPAVHGEVGLLL